MYNVLFYGNLIQTVCIIGFGVLLIWFAETPLDAIVNSTAAIFLGETDDALIALALQVWEGFYLCSFLEFVL
jgi:hypothetical protein